MKIYKKNNSWSIHTHILELPLGYKECCIKFRYSPAIVYSSIFPEGIGTNMTLSEVEDLEDISVEEFNKLLVEMNLES